MREILFRGKRVVNGEWVEGNFCMSALEQQRGLCGVDGYIRLYDSNKGKMEAYEVDRETVGQYTGLKDKNGKRIFEGDIVITQPFSDRPYSKKAKFKQHIGVVRYDVRHYKSIHDEHEQDYKAAWDVDIKDYGGYGCCSWSAFYKCEVIGNIHDNPELMEVEQHD